MGSEDSVAQQDGDQDVAWELSQSPHQIFLERFKLAEDHFTNVEDGLKDRGKRQRVAPNAGTHDDGGSRRTLERAKKINASFHSNEGRGGKLKSSKQIRKNLNMDDSIQAFPPISIFLPSSRQSKSVRKAQAGDEDDAKALRDRKNEKEIAEIYAKMPDDSLLEVLQYFSSNYYNKRQLLYHNIPSSDIATAAAADDDDKGSEELDASSTQFGMLQACEGNALVAMAIYLEEVAKLEANRNRPNNQETTSSITKAFERLNELKRREAGAKIKERMFKGKGKATITES